MFFNVNKYPRYVKTTHIVKPCSGVTCGRCQGHQRIQPLAKHRDYKDPVTPVCAAPQVEASPHKWGGRPCHLYLRATAKLEKFVCIHLSLCPALIKSVCTECWLFIIIKSSNSRGMLFQDNRLGKWIVIFFRQCASWNQWLLLTFYLSYGEERSRFVYLKKSNILTKPQLSHL